MKKLYCEHCGTRINTDTDIYFESDYGSVVYCEECADAHVMFSDSIDSYVHESQYKDTYMDDEISDLDLYTKYEPEGDI